MFACLSWPEVTLLKALSERHERLWYCDQRQAWSTAAHGWDLPGLSSGFAAVCRVKFNPISGHRTDDPDIRLMWQSNKIEVWIVSLPKTGMYVPYRIVPTSGGYASATSSFLKIQTGANPLDCGFEPLVSVKDSWKTVHVSPTVEKPT